MMNLLHAWVAGEREPVPCAAIRVETEARGEDVRIRVGCDGNPADMAATVERVVADARFELARRRVASMGGQLSAAGTAVEITLPPAGNAPPSA
jgi:hypothetical protein